MRGAKHARELLPNGIQYLEFRLFDLNPFEAYGIALNDAKFVHYFILLMAWLDEESLASAVDLGKEKLAQVAWENPLSATAFQAEGERIYSNCWRC